MEGLCQEVAQWWKRIFCNDRATESTSSGIVGAMRAAGVVGAEDASSFYRNVRRIGKRYHDPPAAPTQAQYAGERGLGEGDHSGQDPRILWSKLRNATIATRLVKTDSEHTLHESDGESDEEQKRRASKVHQRGISRRHAVVGR